jgi:hypothetical protein
MRQRHFPPPWRAEEHDACFIVKDRAGHNLAYVYFENEASGPSASKLLSRSEARRIATKFAKLAGF